MQSSIVPTYKRLIIITLRLIVLAVTFIALFIAAGSLTSTPELEALFTPEQQAETATALPLAGLLMSMCLGYLGLRSRLHGWRLAGALFIIFYGICTLLTQIETAVFPAVAHQLPPGALRGFFISGLIHAIPFSLLAVWILGMTRRDPAVSSMSDRLHMPLTEWLWKLAAAALLYVVLYLTFGYYIAWRTPGLPEFYGGVDPGSFVGQLGNVARDTPWLPFLQLLRGLIWAGIGIIIIRMHTGGSTETVLAVGITFAVMMSAGLLFPNPFMPPAVARAHAIELTASNFVNGILLSLLMLWKPAGRVPAAKEAPHAN